ncbi:MAG: hypothetical protein NTW72_14040 [Gemmatimonadetes bacterium]|jgi:hypothetical protein|nr:hypothetical protein [Gemmatimonadota bacterium]
MIKPFEFEASGRSYSCTIEERRGTKGEFWWWFAVSGDAQSYAPFQAASDDTRASVQERVLAFYTNRLFRLTQPTQRSSHWGKRSAPEAAAPEATEATS